MNFSKKIQILLVLSLAIFSMSNIALAITDNIKMRLTKTDGSISETIIKLEKLGDNQMRLRVPYTTFKKNFYTIKYADFISEDATANKGEEGYWVLADGRMGKFTHDAGRIEERRHPMQMYGFKKGKEAFVAIVKQLKYEFSMVVDVENGVYKMYPRFHISEIGMYPYEDLVIDFTYFKGKKANYSSMGKTYRKYQLERGEVRPLKERIEGNPRLKYSSEAIFMKFQMASYMRETDTKVNRGYHWKNIDDPNIIKYRDFDNMMNVLKKLKELGMDKVDVVVANWNWRSNGRCPIYGTAEPELGGNAKCRQLTDLAKKLGYNISPHILHTENYTISPAFDENDLAVKLRGGYTHYSGMGGEAYNPCFKQVYYKQVLENYTNIQQLGFTGPIHIDVTTAITPYPCFSLKHPCTRNDTAFYMNQVGLLSDGFFGGWSSESSCDHAANTLDYVFYVSGYPAYLGKDNPLITRMIPIWQIAYHGIIMSNPFASTVDYNWSERPVKEWAPRESFTPKTRRLKFMEFGGRLSYCFSLHSDKAILDAKQAYDEYQPLKYLQLEYMDFHDEIAPDVFLTRFSDGSRIVTNYTDKPFTYRKQTVPAMEYKLFKPENKKE